MLPSDHHSNRSKRAPRDRNRQRASWRGAEHDLTTPVPYKACSGLTHVTARRIAQPPKGDLDNTFRNYAPSPTQPARLTLRELSWRRPVLVSTASQQGSREPAGA
jgi:hypothetical protein